MTANDTLTALCREWQERLRLQDYDISIEYVRAHALEHCGVGGDCEQLRCKQVVKIRVQDPGDNHPEPMYPHDDEITVVHELLHVHLHGWKVEYDTPAETEKEIAIHRLSEALVKLKRAGGMTIPKYVLGADEQDGSLCLKQI